MDKVLETLNLTPADAIMIPVGAILFLIFWKLSAKMIFVPYLALLDARDRATEGSVSEAEDIRQKALKLEEAYENETSKVRVASMKKKLDKLQAAKTESDKLLDQAESEAQEIVRNERWEFEKTRHELRSEISQEASNLADAAVNRILRG